MRTIGMARLTSVGRGILSALAAAGLLAVLLAPGPIAAQRLSIAPQAGVSLPAGRLNDLEDPGASAALHLSYELVPRVALTADGGYESLHGADLSQGAKAPDMRLWSYTAGVEASLLPRAMSGWSLMADGGLGATTFDSDRFHLPQSVVSLDFHHTYFTARGGLQLGYSVAPNVTAFADGEAYWSRTDRQDTHVLANLDPAQLQKFASAVTFPITIGLRAQL